jgi:hypothetical protein
MTEREEFLRLLEIACHYQNKVIELEEIIELFCLDAENRGED